MADCGDDSGNDYANDGENIVVDVVGVTKVNISLLPCAEKRLLCFLDTFPFLATSRSSGIEGNIGGRTSLTINSSVKKCINYFKKVDKK